MPATGRAEPPSRNVMLYGTEEPLPTAVELRTGPVVCLFEPELALLRYVKYGDQEILRAVYAAVRNKVWGTVTPRVSNVTVEQRASSFRVTFDVDCIEGDIDFAWKGTLTGDERGTVKYDFAGSARSTFLRNRLGFAVLHPVKECAGKACVLEHSSGLKEDGQFPDLISPHQPFKDLRAISHTVVPGLMAEVRFDGEIFETEDHRNWTDGNYKTYCTPLERPYPVEVPHGQQIRQSVTVKLVGQASGARVSRRVEVEVAEIKGSTAKLPTIGLGIAAGHAPMNEKETARIRMLKPAHLRVDVRMWEDGWRAQWDRALKEAAAVGARVEAAVFVSNNAEQELKQLPDGKDRVARWLVFHKDERSTQQPWAKMARAILKGAPVGVGTNEYFTELNRERPSVELIDLSCYSINPQVHAFDNESLVENLEAQADTVRTAQSFLQGKPIAVTPVTLRPRFNPQAQGAPEPLQEGRLPSKIDRRQMSLFGAAWTLGSVKYLSEAGASSITYYETHGWGGVMETGKGSPMPSLFPSVPGGVFPLYHVLSEVNDFNGGTVQPVESNEPLRSCALVLQKGRLRRVLVANLTAEVQPIVVDGRWLGNQARLVWLDEHSYDGAVRNSGLYGMNRGSLMEASGGKYRLALLPYAVVRMDRALFRSPPG